MSKYRIYELAKEFNTTSKVVLDILARNQIDLAKNHMSSVGDNERNIIQRTFTPNRSAENPTEKPQQQQAPRVEKPNIVNNAVQRQQPPQQRNQGVQQPRNVNQGQGQAQNQNNAQNAQQNRNRNASPNGNGPQNVGQQQNYRGNSNGNIQNRGGQQGANQNRNLNNGQQNPNQNRVANGVNTGQQNGSQNRGNGNQINTNGQNRPRPQGAQQQNRPQGAQQQNRPQGAQQQNRPQGQSGPGRGPTTGANTAAPNTAGGQNNRKPPFGQNRNNMRNNNRSNNRRGPNRSAAAATPRPPKPEPIRPTEIQLGESITVKEFAIKLGYEVSEIIKKLMTLGVMATINQEIDFDTASLIAGEFGVKVEELPPEQDPTEIPEIVDEPSTLMPRPPVVTVMGHVDHGKTSLLDVIRKTQVTEKEAGGITQHIGAYQVMCQNKKIVFLDTPGHEAFTAMRARGAQVTDIAILVVAADDGVMPQTIEAINHAKSAEVPIIVAINKMDRPGANPDHVKQQLSEHGLIPEDWGGQTIMVPVSARQKTGISELLEMILLVAEIQEFKANPNRSAQGIIIEAQLDKGRGPVATVLVQKGTLRIGDSIIAGTAHGKVRAMNNDRGERVKKAGPSTPVEVLGMSDVPEAGDVLTALDEKLARSIAEKRIAKKRTDEMGRTQKVSLDALFQQIQDGNIKDLNILIKADVQGSVEALKNSLLALNTSKEVRVTVIHSGVGAVNESDVMLASAANALIIAFNVRPDANARKLADNESIDIRMYRVIYEAIGDVEAAMTGMLAPEYKEVAQGKVEIRQVMSFSKALVAGSYVLEGKVTNSSKIRIIRDGVVVHEGLIESLRRFKDDVKEVAAGFECGITLESFRDIKEGDIIEAYTMEEVKPTAGALNS